MMWALVAGGAILCILLLLLWLARTPLLPFLRRSGDPKILLSVSVGATTLAVAVLVITHRARYGPDDLVLGEFDGSQLRIPGKTARTGALVLLTLGAVGGTRSLLALRSGMGDNK